MNTYNYPITEFNPNISILSGQSFLWEKVDNSWIGTNSNYIFKVTINDSFTLDDDIVNSISFESFPPLNGWEKEFFRLDDNLSYIFNTIDDPLIWEIVKKYKGLRILRQDPFQCTISFICSSNTNIPRIRKMLNNLCKKYGEPIKLDGRIFYSFPSKEKLFKVTLDGLQECGLGYRAKFVKEFIEIYTQDKINFDELLQSDYYSAKKDLMKVNGIGNKVSDCILLFSLDKLNSFPIDVWIFNAIKHYYGNLFSFKLNDLKKMSDSLYFFISELLRDYFGTYAGYAQQYLYYMIRQENKRSWQ